MARYPVTWAQYRAFLDAEDGYRKKAWWQGRPRENEPGALLWSFANYPAINVSWYDALAYCRWLSAKLSLDIRLPTEWEWQWAAAGDTGQEYPWPGEWNPQRANSGEAGIGRTVAVGLYALGRSPFGVDDLAGNVWEWCLNALEQPSDSSLRGDVSRVLRGGAWFRYPRYCRAAARLSHDPVVRYYYVGFRLCCSSPIE
jgi:formylglycine-generating enzyme required for sulfatase activity